MWSPALRSFSESAPEGLLGLDIDGQPAYGLIFGAFMACGVLGGFTEPFFRRAATRFTSSRKKTETESSSDDDVLKPGGVDFLCTICYLLSALLFVTPVVVNRENPYSFSICVGAFLLYEFMVGLYMSCEGVIRSIYMPNESICSLMTMLRVIVNVAVALGVVSTNYVPFTSAFAALSAMMIVAAVLQISLVPRDELRHILKTFVNLRQTKVKMA